MQHVVSVKQFLDTKLLDSLFTTADTYKNMKPAEHPRVLKNKVIATLFYEPSTRTRLSFETAVQRLDGKIITTENASQFSSAIKGESLEDTIRTLNGYVDGIVLRHPVKGSAKIAAEVARVPVLNAGDGSGEHPTQSLLDLFTIVDKCGSPDGLTVGLIGDLRYSRTVHSLIYLLALYKVKIVFVTLPQLQIPASFTKYLTEKGVPYELSASFDDCLPTLDVLYLTRIQKERFKNPADLEAAKKAFMSYASLEAHLDQLKKDALILDPLPRTESSDAVDADPRAVYFEQAANGLFVRMALLQHIFGQGNH